MHSGVNDQLLVSAVRNQYIYKMKAYSGSFCGLILAQAVAALMLLSGSATAGVGGGGLNITFHVYSAQIVMAFTAVWALIIAVFMTTRANKDAVFTIPGNRLSDCLSDMAYIVTGCLFGGVTTALFIASSQNVGKVV